MKSDGTRVLVAALFLGSTGAPDGRQAAGFEPRVLGLELQVSDVDRAVALFTRAGGFRAGGIEGGELAVLSQGEFFLVLRRSDAPAPGRDAAGVHLNLEVSDLEAARARAEAAGADLVEPAIEIPIGRAARVAFAGQHLNLIQPERLSAGGADGPRVYNVGLALESYEEAEAFLDRLGFRVHSRRYLPDALPYARAGAAELVVHDRAVPRDPAALGAAFLLAVDELEPARAALSGRGLDVSLEARATPLGRALGLRGPSGTAVKLVERSSAQLAFERLCALAGSWEGRSTRGWTSRSSIEVIARGSVVVERTNFEAHPGETMLTMFHLDGPRLLLTHYCVAGSQPRLVASEFADGGRSVTFSFLDATNLPARDVGHMDQAVLRFEGPDAFSSLWSWYQAGETRWLEEIRYRRLEAGGPTVAR